MITKNIGHFKSDNSTIYVNVYVIMCTRGSFSQILSCQKLEIAVISFRTTSFFLQYITFNPHVKKMPLGMLFLSLLNRLLNSEHCALSNTKITMWSNTYKLRINNICRYYPHKPIILVSYMTVVYWFHFIMGAKCFLFAFYFLWAQNKYLNSI